MTYSLWHMFLASIETFVTQVLELLVFNLFYAKVITGFGNGVRISQLHVTENLSTLMSHVNDYYDLHVVHYGDAHGIRAHALGNSGNGGI